MSDRNINSPAQQSLADSRCACWGRWNFVPSETHPLGGMEFQVVLALVMLYLVITGNRAFSVVASDSTPSKAAAVPSLASQAA